MLSGISGMNLYAPYGVYGAAYAGRAAQAQGAEQAQAVQRPSAVWAAQRTAQPEVPVQPVAPVKAVSPDEGRFPLSLRQGADPVEMAVRMRIRYMGGPARQGEAGAEGSQAASPVLSETPSAQEVMAEGECQTCKERKYQDGSDDPGVSFQTPTRVDPGQAASAVRGHEMEHVVREQAKATREDRKVVSQSVTLHTAICPECGKAYISGGTTRTVTRADNGRQAAPAPQQGEGRQGSRAPFSAVA